MPSLSQFGLFALLLHIVPPSICNDLKILQKINTSSDALLNIPSRLVTLEQTMAVIVGELEEHRSSSKKKFILNEDIAADINQGRFAIAEEKVLELYDPETFATIVCEMSENSDHDFGVLVNLANGLNNTSLQSHILTNLYYKAKESDNISTRNLIALAKGLSVKGKGYPHEKVVGVRPFKKLLDQITENTISTIVDVMRWRGDYQTNSEVRTLAAGIAEWRDVSEKVMIGLVSGVFANVDSKNILEAVCNHADAWQALVGVNTLIEKLKATDPFKGSIALRIAVHLNQILTRKNLDPFVKTNTLRVKEKIPRCIRNLSSITDFRIWNKHSGSFLTWSQFYFHKPLVSIVMDSRIGNCNVNDTWWLDSYDTKLAFRLLDYTLQASTISYNSFHRVFIAESKNRVWEDKHAWILEPSGDSCFLKNFWNNEYLYASDAEFSEDERNIAGTMAKRSGSTYDNPEFAWQFKNC